MNPISNEIRNLTDGRLRNQIERQSWDPTTVHLWNQIWYQIKDQIGYQILWQIKFPILDEIQRYINETN